MLPFLSSSRSMWWFWFGYCNWRNSQQTLFLSNVTFGSLTQRARAFDTTYNSYKLHDFVDSAGKMSCIFKFNGKSLQSKSFIRCLYSEAMCPSNSQQLTIFSVLKYNFENAYTFVLNVPLFIFNTKNSLNLHAQFYADNFWTFFFIWPSLFYCESVHNKISLCHRNKMDDALWFVPLRIHNSGHNYGTHTHIHIFMDNFVWF